MPLANPTNHVAEMRSYYAYHALEHGSYFDYAGAAIPDPQLLDHVFRKIRSTQFGNPHSNNAAGRRTFEEIEQCRYKILSYFGTNSTEYSVIFTSGATASLKLIGECFDYGPPQNASLIHAQEIHTSCLGMRAYAARKSVPVKSVQLKDLATQFSSQTTSRNNCFKEYKNGSSTDNVAYKTGSTCNSDIRRPGESGFPLRSNGGCGLSARGAAENGSETESPNARICFRRNPEPAGFCDAGSLSSHIGLTDDVIGTKSTEQASNGTHFLMKSSGAKTGSQRNPETTGNFKSAAFTVSSVVTSDHSEEDSTNPVPNYSMGRTGSGVRSSRNLVVFPAQCNFSGFKPSLELIENIRFSKPAATYVCLDAASYVSTNRLDLGKYKPDFVCVSFYKIFGYPTGLGALLVRRGAEGALRKEYYGGGTVFVAAGSEDFHIPRAQTEERFEDGTLPYLEIVSLNACFDWLRETDTDLWSDVSKKTFGLAAHAYHQFQNSRHSNGEALFEIYCLTDYSDFESQGGILSFNMKTSDRGYIGYAEVEKIASVNSCCIRTGCFCNPGACQSFLNLSKTDLIKHFEAGHVCGDENDLVEGLPTGAVRLSFGPQNTVEEIDAFLSLLVRTFKDRELRKANPLPSSPAHQIRLEKIRLFPVKSCGYQEVQKWCIGPTGLLHDREWMIISPGGASVTQKREPKLCMIRPTVRPEEKTLTLEFEGLDPMPIPFEPTDITFSEGSIDLCQTRVCGDRVSIRDCGDEVSEWLYRALGLKGYRLVRKATRRPSKLEANSVLSLANESQYLVVNKESVLELMKEIKAPDGGTDAASSLNQRIDSLTTRTLAKKGRNIADEES